MNGLTPGSEKDQLRGNVDRCGSSSAQDRPERQERRVVVTWDLRQSGWLGRVLGAITVAVLLIWAILFALLAAVLIGLVVALFCVVALKVGRARTPPPNGFGGKHHGERTPAPLDDGNG
jgi:hypothetical protein